MSRLSVAITETRLCEPGPYREYRIDVAHGTSTWHVWRRYSQFDELRNAMCSHSSLPSNAPLPPKGFLQRHVTDVEERMPALDTWLSAVVSCEASLSSPSLLSFLGMLSTIESHGRAPMHCRLLLDRRKDVPAESGDLMLFRTRAAIPAIHFYCLQL